MRRGASQLILRNCQNSSGLVQVKYDPPLKSPSYNGRPGPIAADEWQVKALADEARRIAANIAKLPQSCLAAYGEGASRLSASSVRISYSLAILSIISLVPASFTPSASLRPSAACRCPAELRGGPARSWAATVGGGTPFEHYLGRDPRQLLSRANLPQSRGSIAQRIRS